MKFNYTTEKKKFEQRWERLEKEYREAGMSEEAIQSMREFDWNQFKEERVFCFHNQMLGGIWGDGNYSGTSDGEDESDEQKSPYMNRYPERFSVPAAEYGESDPYGWLEQIEDSDLYQKLKALSADDLEMIRLYAIEGYTVVEIARMQGKSHPTVSKILTRIKKKIN